MSVIAATYASPGRKLPVSHRSVKPTRMWRICSSSTGSVSHSMGRNVPGASTKEVGMGAGKKALALQASSIHLGDQIYDDAARGV